MPELPEVETVCRGLAKALTGARIVKAEAHRPDLRMPLPKNLAARLKGARVTVIRRRAKYILIDLDSDETLLLHLGMSGRMVISHKTSQPGKHDHLVFQFDNGCVVHFNDPRRFGMCDLVATPRFAQSQIIARVGY